MSGEKPGFFIALIEVREQISVLALSGVAGAFFRATLAPEKRVWRRIIQGVAGAFSAIFLGGVFGHALDMMTSSGIYAYLAAGFIMGSGGEVAVKRIQDRILGDDRRGGRHGADPE